MTKKNTEVNESQTALNNPPDKHVVFEEKIDLSKDQSSRLELHQMEEGNDVGSAEPRLKPSLKMPSRRRSVSSANLSKNKPSFLVGETIDLSVDNSSRYSVVKEESITSGSKKSSLRTPSQRDKYHPKSANEDSLVSFPSFSQGNKLVQSNQRVSQKQSIQRSSLKKPKEHLKHPSTFLGLHHKELVVYCLVWINITGAVLSYKFYDVFSTMMSGNTLFFLINLIDQNYIKCAYYLTVVVSYCSGSAGFRYIWHNAQIANITYEKDHSKSLMRFTVSASKRAGRIYVMKRAIFFVIVVFVSSDIILFFDDYPYEYPSKPELLSLRKWLTIPIQALGFGFAHTLTIQEFGVIPMVFT